MTINGFVQKKVDTLTLGERLKKMREDCHLTLHETSKHTRIQEKYLDLLESGMYQKLPADVYVKGFLRTYAHYFGINESVLIKHYEREKGIQKNIGKVEIKPENIKPLRISTFAVTPKIIMAAGTVLLVLSGFFYLYHELKNFVSTPRLIVESPLDGSKIQESTTLVSGVTDMSSNVFINDQAVLVEDNGAFRESVSLRPGLNTIIIRSKNKFNKEVAQTINIQAEYSAISNFSEENGQVASASRDMDKPEVAELERQLFPLRIRTEKKSTWISIEVDGSLVYSGTPKIKEFQNFEAQESFSISAGCGNCVELSINNKADELLGSDNKPVKNKLFQK